MIHPLGAQLLLVLIMIQIMMLHLASIYSYPPPHAQYIPWIRERFQQDPDVSFMGASLSILNGCIFNHDDIPFNVGISWKGHMS